MTNNYTLEDMADGMLPFFPKEIKARKPFSFTFTPLPNDGTFRVIYARNLAGYWRASNISKI